MESGDYSLIYNFAGNELYFAAPGCDYNWWNEGLQSVCAGTHQKEFVESFGCGTVCAEHSDKYFECRARNWRGTHYSECDVDCDATYATSDGGSDGGCDHHYPASAGDGTGMVFERCPVIARLPNVKLWSCTLQSRRRATRCNRASRFRRRRWC